MCRPTELWGRLFLARVLGLNRAVPGALLLAAILNVGAGGTVAVPMVDLHVKVQQTAAASVSLAVGWMLLDEWPRVAPLSRAASVALPLLRWVAVQVVGVGAAALAVTGVTPTFDAVAMASLLCSSAALVAAVAPPTWWLAPLLGTFVTLRLAGWVNPYDPIGHDLLVPGLVGAASATVFVAVSALRSTARCSLPSRLL